MELRERARRRRGGGWGVGVVKAGYLDGALSAHAAGKIDTGGGQSNWGGVGKGLLLDGVPCAHRGRNNNPSPAAALAHLCPAI